MSEELENLTQETKKGDGSEPFNKDTLPEKPESKVSCCKITCAILILLVTAAVAAGLYCFITFIMARPVLYHVPAMRHHKYDRYLKFDKEGENNYQTWTYKVETILTAHTNSCVGDCNMIKCDFETKKRPAQSCSIDLRKHGPCVRTNFYGYKNNTPCLFLHLKTQYGWIPEYYNDTKDLPEDMPEDLKDFITNLSSQRPEMLNSLWVSCEPSFGTTKQEMGTLNYYPYRGFPGYYYPEDGNGFQAPLIALQFEKPQVNASINVHCQVWGKNVHRVFSDFEFKIS